MNCQSPPNVGAVDEFQRWPLAVRGILTTPQQLITKGLAGPILLKSKQSHPDTEPSTEAPGLRERDFLYLQ